MLTNQPHINLQGQGVVRLDSPEEDLPLVETLNISDNQVYGLDFLTRLPNLRLLVANNVPQQRVPAVAVDEIETNVILQLAAPPRLLHFTQGLSPLKVMTCFFPEFKVAARQKVTTGLLKFHYDSGMFLGKRATNTPVENSQIRIHYIEYEEQRFTTLLVDETDLKQFAHGYKMRQYDTQNMLFVCIRSNSGDGVFIFRNGAFIEEAEALSIYQSRAAANGASGFEAIGQNNDIAGSELLNTINQLPNNEVSFIESTDRKRKMVHRLGHENIALERDTIQMGDIKVGEIIDNAEVYLTQVKAAEFVQQMKDALQISELHAESLLLQLKAADFTDYELHLQLEGCEFVALLGRKEDQFREDEVGRLCFAVTAEGVRVLKVVNGEPRFLIEKFREEDEVISFKVSVNDGAVCFVYFNGKLHAELSSGEREITVAGGLWRILFVQNGAVEAEEEIIG